MLFASRDRGGKDHSVHYNICDGADSEYPFKASPNRCQFVVFSGVNGLQTIDNQRHRLGKTSRFQHDEAEGLLIVKVMPSVLHEMAHLNLIKGIYSQMVSMQMGLGNLVAVGSARFKGKSTSKEGDSAFKPLGLRRNSTDWPTIVFETGLSESRCKLRADAAWWLSNSDGDVKIVVSISNNIDT